MRWIISIVGVLAGGLLSAGVSSLFESTAGMWPSAVTGAAFGWAGTLSGQNRIEALAMAVISSILLALLLITILEQSPLGRELATGFLVGFPAGYLANAYLTPRNE